MGRLDVNATVAVEADDDLLDKLEDVDSQTVVDIDMDLQLGDVHPQIIANNPTNKSTRRLLEDRLEDLRLQRQITDYGSSLH